MFDELMLADTAVVAPHESGDRVALLGIRLPWYRSLPLSCIERLDLSINGQPQPVGSLSLRISDIYHSIESLAELFDVSWFVLDQATLRFPVPSGLACDVHTVSLTMLLRIPYTDPDFAPFDYKQVATCERPVSFIQEAARAC